MDIREACAQGRSLSSSCGGAVSPQDGVFNPRSQYFVMHREFTHHPAGVCIAHGFGSDERSLSGRLIGPVIHIDRALVAAALAGHKQAPDAMLAHACRSSRDGWVRHLAIQHVKNRQGTKSSDRDRFLEGNQCSFVGLRTRVPETDPDVPHDDHDLTAAAGDLPSPRAPCANDPAADSFFCRTASPEIVALDLRPFALSTENQNRRLR